jgi:hypothetical protein
MKTKDLPPIIATASPSYLGREALAEYSGVSLRQVDYWLADPTRPLPTYRFGRRVTVKLSDFDAWARVFRVEGGSLEARIDSKPLGDARRRLRRLRRERRVSSCA